MSDFTEMGIEINGSHSYYDYGLYVAERNIDPPARQTNFVTIPYMNGYYDYGKINGVYYSGRPLTYSFDLMAKDEIAVEALKNELISWAETAVESKIYDDADPEYYYIGSYTDSTYTADSNLPEFGGRLTLKFMAQPYRYNRETDEAVL